MFVLAFSGARFRLCSLYLTPVLEFKTWKENRCKHHGNLIWKKKKNSSSNDVKPVLINVGLAPWGAPTLVQWGSPRWPPDPPSLQTSLRQWVDASPSAARDRTPLHLWVKTCFQHILVSVETFLDSLLYCLFFVFLQWAPSLSSWVSVPVIYKATSLAAGAPQVCSSSPPLNWTLSCFLTGIWKKKKRNSTTNVLYKWFFFGRQKKSFVVLILSCVMTHLTVKCVSQYESKSFFFLRKALMRLLLSHCF